MPLILRLDDHGSKVSSSEPEQKHERRNRSDPATGQSAHESAAERQGKQRAGAGTACEAEDVGIRQRIAEQNLHERPGNREQTAAGECRQDPREPQRLDDLSMHRSVVGREEVGQCAQRCAIAAGGDRRQYHDDGREPEPRKDGRTPASLHRSPIIRNR